MSPRTSTASLSSSTSLYYSKRVFLSSLLSALRPHRRKDKLTPGFRPGPAGSTAEGEGDRVPCGAAAAHFPGRRRRFVGRGKWKSERTTEWPSAREENSKNSASRHPIRPTPLGTIPCHLGHYTPSQTRTALLPGWSDWLRGGGRCCPWRRERGTELRGRRTTGG